MYYLSKCYSYICNGNEAKRKKTGIMKTSNIIIGIFSIILVLVIVFGDMKG